MIAPSPDLPSPRRWRIAFAVVIAIAIALRFLRWMHARDLWLDELLLSMNVLGRSLGGMFSPLDYGQGAPVGFLTLQKLAVMAFGDGERAQRLIPLGAAIGSILLFAAIARRMLKPLFALGAMILFATAEPLIYYANEAKQYGVDVLVALGAVWLALRLLENPSPRRRRAFLVAIPPALFLSHPAVFPLAGACAIFIWRGRGAQCGQFKEPRLPSRGRLGPIPVTPPGESGFGGCESRASRAHPTCIRSTHAEKNGTEAAPRPQCRLASPPLPLLNRHGESIGRGASATGEEPGMQTGFPSSSTSRDREGAVAPPTTAAWQGAGILLLAFAANHLLFLRSLAASPSLNDYWRGAFMPRDFSAIGWLARSLYAPFTHPNNLWLVWPAVAPVAAMLAALGLLAWRRRGMGGLMVAPIALALLAAMMGKYPFADRLILWIVPALILLMAAGAEWLAGRVSRPVALALGLAILLPNIGRAARFALFPPGREEVTPLLAHIAANRQSGDTLYAYHAANAAFAYYGPRYGLADIAYIEGRRDLSDSAGVFDADVRRLVGHQRVWILLDHQLADAAGQREWPILLNALDRLGHPIARPRSTPGAQLWLYDLSPAPE